MKWQKIGTYRLSIAGGEPLIEKDFFEFVKYAREKDIDVSFTTNGLCFNEENIKKLNDLKLKTLTISLDRGSKETYEAIRRVGNFQKLLDNLNLLKKLYKRNISFKTTLMKTNIKELKEILKFAEQYECNSLKFNCIRPDGRSLENKNLLLNQDEYLEAIEILNSLESNKVKIKIPLNINQKSKYTHMKELGFGCFAGKESMCISPLGEVKACSHMPKELIAGNIKNDKIEKIWNTSKNLILFRTLEGNKECNSCENYDYCRSGCRYRALFYNKSLNSIDPFCYMRKNRE